MILGVFLGLFYLIFFFKKKWEVNLGQAAAQGRCWSGGFALQLALC